jgi:chemotaxis signal transduction protein
MDDNSTIEPVSSLPVIVGDKTELTTENKNRSTSGFLCFYLDRTEFAINLNLVKQIILVPPVTFVPRTKSCFPGVISVRGRVVTLIDLRQLLGFTPSKITKASRALLFDTEGEQVGLLVDRVSQVRRVFNEHIEYNPVLEENPMTEKVVGIIRPDSDVQITLINIIDIIAEALK